VASRKAAAARGCVRRAAAAPQQADSKPTRSRGAGDVGQAAHQSPPCSAPSTTPAIAPTAADAAAAGRASTTAAPSCAVRAASGCRVGPEVARRSLPHCLVALVPQRIGCWALSHGKAAAGHGAAGDAPRLLDRQRHHTKCTSSRVHRQSEPAQPITLCCGARRSARRPQREVQLRAVAAAARGPRPRTWRIMA